jgi:hypothetical protein
MDLRLGWFDRDITSLDLAGYQVERVNVDALFTSTKAKDVQQAQLIRLFL